MPESAQAPKAVLLVFARSPAPGKVKTRLAKDVGAEAAVRVYRFLAEGVWREVAPGGFARWLFFTPAGEEDLVKRWLPGADRYLPQPDEEDLGFRLAFAFEAAFRSGADKVVVVGTDVPELTAALVRQAFDLLEGHSAVLGPSHDGGFWLLGICASGRVSFDGIEWGTSKAGRGMLHNLRSAGHLVAELPVLTDVDTLKDLKRFPYLTALTGNDLEGA